MTFATKTKLWIAALLTCVGCGDAASEDEGWRPDPSDNRTSIEVFYPVEFDGGEPTRYAYATNAYNGVPETCERFWSGNSGQWSVPTEFFESPPGTAFTLDDGVIYPGQISTTNNSFNYQAVEGEVILQTFEDNAATGTYEFLVINVDGGSVADEEEAQVIPFDAIVCY